MTTFEIRIQPCQTPLGEVVRRLCFPLPRPGNQGRKRLVYCVDQEGRFATEGIMRRSFAPAAFLTLSGVAAASLLMATAPRADAPPSFLFSSNRDGGPKLYSVDLDFNN